MRTAETLQVAPAGDREVVLARGFDAPRALVFDAYTKPELLKRWLGVVGGWSLAVCEVDLRPGGEYRYVWRHPDHPDMGMRGVYEEVVRPERIVFTEAFDDPWYPGGAVGTVVLTEAGGRTTLTVTMRYETPEARDAVLRSPMADGVAASYDRLAEVLGGG